VNCEISVSSLRYAVIGKHLPPIRCLTPASNRASTACLPGGSGMPQARACCWGMRESARRRCRFRMGPESSFLEDSLAADSAQVYNQSVLK
jgi:hypothetical protein